MSEKKEEFIELISLIKYVYQGRKLVVKSVIVMAIVGVIFSLLIPNTFTSGATFLPQTGSSDLKSAVGLGGLASLAGINLSGLTEGSEIPTNLYPKIVTSIPYRKTLLNQEVVFEDRRMTLEEYLMYRIEHPSFIGRIRKFTIGLPTFVLKQLKGKAAGEDTSPAGEIYQMTEKDKILFLLLSDQLNISLNDKEGFVSLSFTDLDKEVASQVAQIATDLLQERIINYKSQSAKEVLLFSEEQFKAQQVSFNKLQDSISFIKDSNLYIKSSLFQNQVDRLERELSISQALLEELAKQVEQAKLQVNKDTPIFMVIDPVTTPYEKSAPSRALIVLIWIFLGVFFSVAFLVLKKPVGDMIMAVKVD